MLHAPQYLTAAAGWLHGRGHRGLRDLQWLESSSQLQVLLRVSWVTPPSSPHARGASYWPGASPPGILSVRRTVGPQGRSVRTALSLLPLGTGGWSTPTSSQWTSWPCRVLFLPAARPATPRQGAVMTSRSPSPATVLRAQGEMERTAGPLLRVSKVCGKKAAPGRVFPVHCPPVTCIAGASFISLVSLSWP